MDALPLAINASTYAAAVTIFWLATRASMRKDLARQRRERARADARLDRLEDKIDAVRTDITQLAFRLGERPHPQTG